MSVQRFAEEYELSAQRLYYWRQRLKPSVTHESVEELGLVPVLVRNERNGVALRVRVKDIELELLEPMTIDPAWLAATVSMLREGPCS